MLRSQLSKRLFSTSTTALNGERRSTAEFLRGKVDQANFTKDEKVNIKGPFIQDFKVGQIYDPFDFSLASINLAKQKAKATQGQNKTFDKKRLNPLDFYTNPSYLSKYLTTTGRILPRDVTKLSLKNQARLAKAIKRARSAGLLSSVHVDVSDLIHTNFETRRR